MPIDRGEDWGRPGALPPDGVVVHSDAEANEIVTAARRAGAAIPPLGLAGGDLARSLGGRGDVARLHTAEAVQLSCDLGAALLDGRLVWFVSHLVMRRSWLRGPVIAVMNGGLLRRWDVAPRAHPGDGRLDVVEADLGLADRWKALRRLPTGAHVPHPRISQRQVTATQFEFASPMRVDLDGAPTGRVERVSVRVEPDTLLVVV